MLYLQNALRMIVRQRHKGLLVICTSLVFVVFVNVYADSIDKHLVTLREMHANIETIAVLTGPTMVGTTDLRIPERAIDLLEKSGFVQRGFYSRSLIYQLEPFGQNDFERSGRLVGIKELRAIADFANENAVQPTFLDGYDASLFQGDAKLCVVSTGFLNMNALQIGDEFEFAAYENHPDYHPGINSPSLSVTFRIIGTYPSSRPRSDIYVPWDTVSELFTALHLAPTWDSGRLILENTANLPDFRAYLARHRFNHAGQGDDDINHNMPGIIIYDRILMSTVGSVQKQIDLMTYLYPVIYLLCVGIGFLLSYLLIRLRITEYAIMRSLGTGRWGSFSMFFVEQGVLTIVGACLGIGLTRILISSITTLQLYSVGGYIISYWIGSAIAILSLNRGNIVQILTAKE